MSTGRHYELESLTLGITGLAMNVIFRDIFRAIHEGKWLSIEYHNRENQQTKYWIGIRDIDIRNRTLAVEGLHLGQYTVGTFDKIMIDSIQASGIIEGSFYPVNDALVRDIYLNPHKYNTLFDNTANLKILSYLEQCNRMDCVPYKSDFSLIRYLDQDNIQGELYQLNAEQFQAIVKKFQYEADEGKRSDGGLRIKQLAMNVLSIHMAKGLYVLAYRNLNLDVKQRALRPDAEITICTEFTINGSKQSIRRFLDAEEYDLLNNFEANQEKIKDCIMSRMSQNGGNVDDMPHIIGLESDVAIDLHREYQSIMKIYQEKKVPVPIAAFLETCLSDRGVRVLTPLR